MTQKKKLIIGAVVVLVAYYLYDRNRKMKVVSDLKAGAETPATEKDKLAKCTKKVEEEIATTMFKTTANFDMNVYKKEAIDRCLKAGAETIVAENIDVPTIINKGVPEPAQSKSDLNFSGSVKGQYFR